MYCTRNVSDSVVWVGASDRRLALFENLFPIPRGVSYNSYLILDEKTALLLMNTAGTAALVTDWGFAAGFCAAVATRSPIGSPITAPISQSFCCVIRT